MNVYVVCVCVMVVELGECVEWRIEAPMLLRILLLSESVVFLLRPRVDDDGRVWCGRGDIQCIGSVIRCVGVCLLGV